MFHRQMQMCNRSVNTLRYWPTGTWERKFFVHKSQMCNESVEPTVTGRHSDTDVQRNCVSFLSLAERPQNFKCRCATKLCVFSIIGRKIPGLKTINTDVQRNSVHFLSLAERCLVQTLKRRCATKESSSPAIVSSACLSLPICSV